MDPQATHQDLVAHYERLRREVLGSPFPDAAGFGRALFLRRGMTAWMQAWAECGRRIEPDPPSQPRVEATVTADLRAQITALLVGMILSRQQEVTP
jgi:hypothetical protein